jgi:hypothetical protein
MPRHDPGRAPHVRTPDGRVRGRHLLPLAVIRDRGNLDAQVGGDIGCRPPLGIWVRERHAPKDTAAAPPSPLGCRIAGAARVGGPWGQGYVSAAPGVG